MLQACYFRSFWLAWLCTPKVILSTCSKLLYLSAGKKSTSSTTFLWRYCSGDIAKAWKTYFRYVMPGYTQAQNIGNDF